eukprot:7317283-Prymnesium_polylepis.1
MQPLGARASASRRSRVGSVCRLLKVHTNQIFSFRPTPMPHRCWLEPPLLPPLQRAATQMQSELWPPLVTEGYAEGMFAVSRNLLNQLPQQAYHEAF